MENVLESLTQMSIGVTYRTQRGEAVWVVKHFSIKKMNCGAELSLKGNFNIFQNVIIHCLRLKYLTKSFRVV